MAVTIKDLARICGVSVGTVDRALRNRSEIHPRTRERAGLEHMAARNVDGILLFPTSSDGGFDDFLRRLGRPIVTIANRVSPAWPFVGAEATGRLSGRRRAQIIHRGYRRLLFVGPFDAFRERINLYEIEERYAGLQDAVRETPGDREPPALRERLRGEDPGAGPSARSERRSCAQATSSPWRS